MKNPFKPRPGGGGSAREPSVWRTRWFTSLLSFCILLLIVAVIVEFYWRAEIYASQTIKKQFDQGAAAKTGTMGGNVPLFCELMNKPAWLDKTILSRIFAETQAFAARDQATYEELKNPEDQEILRAVAENYTGTDSKGVNHWTLRENGWIKRITEVRRVIAPDRKSQTIEIFAEYRQPAAWVVYDNSCYLIDGEMVRLPGVYSPADRRAMPGLMAVTGVALPAGSKGVPAPSETWSGADLAAGMRLAELLHGERFASQIDAIDMSNFEGRRDAKQLWIVLDTIWTCADDPSRPRVIQWGRPVGEERFYDVSAATKIKALNQIFMRFARIDANRDYVDVHTEQVWVPKLQAPGDGGSAPVPRG